MNLFVELLSFHLIISDFTHIQPSQAYSISGRSDAIIEAERIYNKIKEINENGDEHIKVTRIGYTSLIRALVGHAKNGDAIKAENFINEMESIYHAGDNSMKPEPFVYNMVCNAYAKEGNVEKAWAMFRRREMEPSIITYTTLLNAMANSKDKEAPQKVMSDI